MYVGRNTLRKMAKWQKIAIDFYERDNEVVSIRKCDNSLYRAYRQKKGSKAIDISNRCFSLRNAKADLKNYMKGENG